ncbi:hypothetical protein BH11PLA2_BH11PLA2_35710 [soil metagenome]
MRLSNARKAGFTLIELLVTMALIIVLLSIAVAVSNSAAIDSYKLVGSADKVAQALLTSKSRALRDRAPRGIRFNIDPGTNFVREIVYIESGEPWLPDQTETYEQGGNPPVINPNRSQFVIKYPVTPGAVGSAGPFPKPLSSNCRAYLLLNNNANANRANGTQRGDSDYQRFLREVQVGDVVYSPDLGAAVTITSTSTAGTGLDNVVGVPPGFSVLEVNASGMTNPDMAAGFTDATVSQPQNVRNRGTFQTTQFGIYRSPRPIAGEPTLILSKNVAIDTAASLGVTPGVPFDILFAPSGQVMNNANGIVALTVRDTFKFTPTAPASPANWLSDATNGPSNFKLAGEMVLVAIYPKTGTVATKPVLPVDATNTDPYKFVRDAINSGF